MKKIALALCLISLLIASNTVLAQENESIATVIAVDGTATVIINDTEKNTLTADDKIFANDTIETEKNSKILFLMSDDTEFTIGENAYVTIDEYIYDPQNSQTNKANYSILRGAFLYVSGLIGKKENPDITFTTPIGSIGIRGTTVWGGDIDDAYSIFVADGKVSVSNKRGKVTLEKGEGTNLVSDIKAPTKPKMWGEGKISRALETITLQTPMNEIEQRLNKKRAEK